jgi:hypothetical protein
MFSFLKKVLGENLSNSKWTILSGQENGKSMVVRRNNSAKQYFSKSKFNYRVGVAIPLLEPNDVGLPSKEEMESLNLIEDELSKQLEKDDSSIQVLAITTDGMREFVYYTCNSEIIGQVIYNIRSKFPSYEIQFYVKEDKEWSVYKEFA